MTAPADATDVLNALRFGWYVAEVRGRNRPGGPQPPADQLPNRDNHVLPLNVERTAAELRIEAQAVLTKLATDLGVDTHTVNNQPQSRTHIIDQQARALSDARHQAQADAQAQGQAQPPAVATAWDALAASIYQLDASTQDILAAKSDMESAAYQLGRGLAETYWALDPGAADNPLTPNCWLFLLGEHRADELGRLTGRLSAYFNPYCSPAIAGTVRLWQAVAADQTWRQGAQVPLYNQLRRWYELLILGQDPSTLIKPYELVKNWRARKRTLTTVASAGLSP